ncbi:plasmid replication protein, CyRepA1 family [Photobacterium satsumensis]|uniref:plasmid replication protein, CyRepA1 family n=1 Tax=Photobacterium satsumensis TaxID=2910239 RepID=UPI003D0A3D39
MNIPSFDIWALKRPNLTDVKKPLEKFASLENHEEIAAYAMALSLRHLRDIPVKWQTAEEFMDHLLAYNNKLSTETITKLKWMIAKHVNKTANKAVSLITMGPLVKVRHNYHLITDLADIGGLGDGVHVLSAGHGAGKTGHVGIPFANDSSGKFMAMCHLQSLTLNIAKRFEITGYEEYKAEIKRISALMRCNYKQAIAEESRNALAICLNSMISTLETWLDDVDSILIDEISQVLAALGTGDHINELERAQLYNKLVAIVSKAKRVLVMDADLDDTVIHFLESCRPNEKFNVYEVPRQDNGYSVEWVYGAHDRIPARDTAIEKSIAMLLDGKKVIIATDGRDTAKYTGKIINQTVPSAKVLVINSQTTKTREVQDFLRNPTEAASQYDAVIHSPSMRSGVSIESDHFDHGVCIFAGKSITPQDAIQMMRRARNLTSWFIAVAESYNEGIEDVAVMESQQEALGNFEGYNEEAESKPLNRFINIQKAKETTAKNMFAVGLYHQLQAYKFSISHCEERAADYSGMGEMRKADKEHFTSLMLNSTQIDQHEYTVLKNTDNKSETERAQLESFKIRTYFGLSSLEEEHIELWNNGRGRGRIRMLEALMDGEEIHDETKELSSSQRSFVNVKAAIFKELLSMTDIKIEDGMVSGRITQQQEKALLEDIWSDRLLYSYLGIIPAKFSKPKSVKPKCAKKLLKPMFEKAGIEISSNKIGVYDGGRKAIRILVVNEEKMGLICHVAKQKCMALSEVILKKNPQSAIHSVQKIDSGVSADYWGDLPDREVALPSQKRANYWKPGVGGDYEDQLVIDW